MNFTNILIVAPLFSLLFISNAASQRFESVGLADQVNATHRSLNIDDITIEKQFLYKQYTLQDEYSYLKADRKFQWDKIKQGILAFESLVAQKNARWGILQNYNNKNGVGAAIKSPKMNVYNRLTDSYGVERYQGVPVYDVDDLSIPVRYARDGHLARIVSRSDSSKFVRVEIIDIMGEFCIPSKYIKEIEATKEFKMAIFVDKTNQNITTLERVGTAKWLVRSMNPATTGVHQPPYKEDTPSGMFVLQDRKAKMFYVVDGTSTIAGFAPWANRFTRGAYIHGVPVNSPTGAIVEYSSSLGTTPRSHMCVRNASSHAKFVYDWATTEQTLVFVIE